MAKRKYPARQIRPALAPIVLEIDEIELAAEIARQDMHATTGLAIARMLEGSINVRDLGHLHLALHTSQPPEYVGVDPGKEDKTVTYPESSYDHANAKRRIKVKKNGR